MKKIVLFNFILDALGVSFVFLVRSIFSFNQVYFLTFFIFPFLAGIVTVLAQKKEKSYAYLPVLFLFSTFSTFLAVFLFKIWLYADGAPGFIIWPRIEEFFIYLVLFSIYIFGGLIGLAIRGVNDIFFPRYRLDFTNLSKRTYFIIMSLIVAIMIGGFYYASTLPKDWKNYTNKEYEFSIDYPADWHVLESLEHIGPYVAFDDKKIEKDMRYPKVKLTLENSRAHSAHMKEFSSLEEVGVSNLERDFGRIKRVRAEAENDSSEPKPFEYSEIAIIPDKRKGYDSYIVLQYYENEYSGRNRWLFDQMVRSFDYN
jgi:hypothetical protein